MAPDLRRYSPEERQAVRGPTGRIWFRGMAAVAQAVHNSVWAMDPWMPPGQQRPMLT
jgi:hypothetical protein